MLTGHRCKSASDIGGLRPDRLIVKKRNCRPALKSAADVEPYARRGSLPHLLPPRSGGQRAHCLLDAQCG